MKNLAHSLLKFPRTKLSHLPTPLEPLPRLEAALGGPPLYVKRDDCTGFSGGGNKTRKLEFVVGDALARGSDLLITTGGIQSNHARQTAGFAARLGLECELVLLNVVDNSSAEYAGSGNALLDRLTGAQIRIEAPAGTADGTPVDAVQAMQTAEGLMEDIADQARRGGKTPYIVPAGASTAIGALGYAECAQEIVTQSAAQGFDVDWVVLGSGSGGTQAGLIAGFKALGVDTKVLGIGVSGTSQAPRRETVKTLARETAELLGWHGSIEERDIHVDGDYVGGGYGVFGDDVIAAVKTAAEMEALLIDPVYTGKAMAGLIDLIKKGKFSKNETVVFLHTGGLPGLFAYSDQFSASPILGSLKL